MSTRLDPQLLKEFKDYGAVGIEKCFNCGNCTAICPLTSDEYPFPRNMIRRIQIGDRDKIKQSLDPWLCYYCGDCSETCPKAANPGETMMAARRWLTAQYDWTGLARKFYTSEAWEFGSMILLGLLVVITAVLFHGPIVTDRVELNTFAPVEFIHIADWVMAGLLLFFIATNVLRMHKFIMRGSTKENIPIQLYLTEFWNIVVHFATQKRWSECNEGEEANGKNLNWISHLLLVSGYVLMLVIIIFFLKWFQTDNLYPIWHPQRWLGYYATIVLLFGSGRVIWGRLKKTSQMHQFSHPSDWIFPVLLLVVTLTGIFQHAFRYWGMPLATYYTYVIHLAFVAPMLILEVPFGKWSHLYYRPLAIYFQKIKEKAKEKYELEIAVPAAAD
ncbi:MAG: 4Fe-4S dicluster domain-containing protein [Anaerolineales bacterium]|jgi:ferredoxin